MDLVGEAQPFRGDEVQPKGGGVVGGVEHIGEARNYYVWEEFFGWIIHYVCLFFPRVVEWIVFMGWFLLLKVGVAILIMTRLSTCLVMNDLVWFSSKLFHIFAWNQIINSFRLRCQLHLSFNFWKSNMNDPTQQFFYLMLKYNTSTMWSVKWLGEP